MILFQLEINLLLTKIKEIHRHYEQINHCLNTLHQKRINRTEKNIQQNSQNIALINNDKTQRKKPLFLVKRNGVIKNETICNVPKILKEKVNFMGTEKNKNVKKKHIVLHKKNKLLRNRYFNSVTGQLYETNDINDLPDETSTFELEDDLFDGRENKEIDEYYDICEKDKLFFKLWNNFVNKLDSENYFLIEKKLLKFIEENFIIHIINLYDHGKLNRSTYSKIIKVFQEKIDEFNVKYS